MYWQIKSATHTIKAQKICHKKYPNETYGNDTNKICHNRHQIS